ncbi:hypothetical protein [Paenibacillus sp. Z6-24]
MYKKLMVLFLVILFLNACSNANALTKAVNSNQNENMAYTIKNRSYQKENVNIRYPQIEKLTDPRREEKINDILKNQALRILQYGYSESTRIEIEYKISYQNNNVLSVKYSGLSYKKGDAYPTNQFYTTNIDITKGKLLKINDLLKIDSQLFSLFKSNQFKAVLEEQQDLKEIFSENQFIQLLHTADSSEHLGAMDQSYVFSYLENGFIGLSLPVTHALGDHAEYEIKIQDIPKEIKQSQFTQILESSPYYNISSNMHSSINLADYEINENQSFDVTLEHWGDIKFISTTNKLNSLKELQFFLSNKNGDVIYMFPEFYGNRKWLADGIKAVSFKDVNGDKRKDVVIIAEYTTAVGKQAAEPFPVASIYFQDQDGTFQSIPALDDKLNGTTAHNRTIAEVVKYASQQHIKVN